MELEQQALAQVARADTRRVKLLDFGKDAGNFLFVRGNILAEQEVVHHRCGFAAQVAIVVNRTNDLHGDGVFALVVEFEQAQLLFEIFVESIFKSQRHRFFLLVATAPLVAGFVCGGVVFDEVHQVIIQFHIIVAEADGFVLVGIIIRGVAFNFFYHIGAAFARTFISIAVAGLGFLLAFVITQIGIREIHLGHPLRGFQYLVAFFERRVDFQFFLDTLLKRGRRDLQQLHQLNLLRR